MENESIDFHSSFIIAGESFRAVKVILGLELGVVKIENITIDQCAH